MDPDRQGKRRVHRRADRLRIDPGGTPAGRPVWTEADQWGLRPHSHRPLELVGTVPGISWYGETPFLVDQGPDDVVLEAGRDGYSEYPAIPLSARWRLLGTCPGRLKESWLLKMVRYNRF